ncbi:MAG: hypothetical protein HKN23_04560 [Verrucomicrobiales bacterium]|nr:hypothetical protein [Verrucomicrobiales bacterium]
MAGFWTGKGASARKGFLLALGSPLPLVTDLRAAKVPAGIVPTEHSLITELEIEAGIFEIQTSRRAELQPV